MTDARGRQILDFLLFDRKAWIKESSILPTKSKHPHRRYSKELSESMAMVNSLWKLSALTNTMWTVEGTHDNGINVQNNHMMILIWV